MKKWFSNKNGKKSRIAMVGCLTLMMTAGTTYAWWTAEVQSTQTITMGKLAIDGNLKKPSSLTNWEPGLEVDAAGSIKNTGSIDTLVKISGNNKIKKVEDTEFVDAGEMTKLTVGPQGSDTYVGFDGTGTRNGYYWFGDAAGNVYLLMMPNATVKLDTLTELVGDKMGNDTMGAEIQIALDFDATQVLDGAASAYFGITLSDLGDLDGIEVGGTPEFKTALARTAPSKGMQYLQKLMARGK